MRFDLERRTLRIGVREIVEREVSLGPRLGRRDRAEQGRACHAAIRAARLSGERDYRCEVALSHTLCLNGYQVTIHGRVDGLERVDGRLYVEEYKSVGVEVHELRGASAFDFPAARLQLGIYLYMLEQAGECPAGGRLVLVSAFGGGEEWVVAVDPFPVEVSEYLETRLGALITAQERRGTWLARRRQYAATLPFPYEERRGVQRAMAGELAHAMGSGNRLLLEAPTGVGKTAAVVHSLLGAAFASGAAVFYATAKTTGQAAVRETLERMVRRGADVTGLVLTARSKLCPHEEVLCRPEACVLLREHRRKVVSTGVIQRLLETHVVDRAQVVQEAEQVGVCPFQLSLDLVGEVDLVIGDYNYVFSPNAYLGTVFESNDQKWLLAIDEAHNLPGRAREYYSPLLSWRATKLLESWAEQRGGAMGQRLLELVREVQAYFWAVLQDTGLESTSGGHAPFEPDRERLGMWKRTLSRLLAGEAVRSPAFHTWDTLEVPFRFHQQLAAYEEGVSRLDETATSLVERTGDDVRLRVLCLDPAPRLGARMRRFEFVVAMSATLSPEGFYRDVLGMGPDTPFVALGSPFPPENCATCVVGSVPDRFRAREAAIPRFVEVVRTVAEARHGLYAVYVSSHELLARVAPALQSLGYRLFIQRPDMDDRLRHGMLAAACRTVDDDPNRSTLLLAVLGGSFGEAIECPAGVLSGVIVFGPGLPRVCLEQELLRNYYDNRFGEGFEYAYVYPGMTRVLQAAGRLIRRERDVGCLVLVGERFTETPYRNLFPPHWYRRSPAELETNDLGHRLERFWSARSNDEEASSTPTGGTTRPGRTALET